MKALFWIPTFCALVLSLSSCGNSGNKGSGSSQAVTGPFDSSGRYREDWADDPSKWRRSGGTSSPHEMKSDRLPEIARNEQPPETANPLPPARVISNTEVASKPKAAIGKPREIVVKTKHSEKPEAVTAKSKHSVEKTKEVVVKSKHPAEKSREVTSKSKSAEKSKEVVVKSKAKPVVTKEKEKTKSKSTHYVVKQGDSLSSIASHTGSSISAIKSENGISGNLIRPGQSLTIPKK